MNRRLLKLSAATICAASLSSQACGDSSDGDTATPLEPPALVFLGAENSRGDTFEPDEGVLSLRCDAFVSFHLGPTGSLTGSIENWSLRPPGVCGSLQQCGYVQMTLLDDSGETVASIEQAVASPFFDLSNVDPSTITEARATLIADGGSEFLQDGEAVQATWSLEIEVPNDCDVAGTGGSGGSTGQGGSGPEIGGAGGDGGAGGARDE